ESAGAGAGNHTHRQSALDERGGDAGLPRALGAATREDQRRGDVGGATRPLARLRGSEGHQQRQHAGERDQGRLVTTTAASTRANAAASFQRSRSPSQSQAKAAKTTSVMTSCAIFSCAAVYRP